MELDDFISGTLKALIKGIKDSQEFAEQNGAIINPIIRQLKLDEDKLMFRKEQPTKDGLRYLTEIEFDVAVIGTNEKSKGTGGGLKIQVLSLGASVSKTESSQTTSRIKFMLKAALPHQGDN